MLKTRVIPTLLWKDFGLVKGVGFDSWRGVGSVMPAIKIYQLRDVDELILLDLSSSNQARTLDFDTIEELAQECRVPLTVGGGVQDVSVIRRLLQAGADKVAINSHAYEQPELVRQAANMFGSQCVVASIDVRKEASNQYRCYRSCGTDATDHFVVEWAQRLQDEGAGEILITSVERDGSMEGYDLDLIRIVSDAVSIPVIAAGGAGKLDDFRAAIQDANASAVAAASIFHFTQCTPHDVKQFLHQSGIPVRNSHAKMAA